MYYHWVSYRAPVCEECNEVMYFKCHGNPRTLNIMGNVEHIIHCYYECRTPWCSNESTLVAKHPEILYKKLYSKSTFARVVYLKHVRKFSVNQILEDLPYLKIGTCYEILRTYRAAARVRADKRIAAKFPPGTKIRVSIDAMEPEKGQPSLYTIREVSEHELLGARFLEDSSADAIHELMEEIRQKYGVEFIVLVSDKQKGIVAMHDRFFPEIPHQYCIVHFFDNVTKELREADRSLQKDLRSDVRSIATLNTIKKKARKGAPGLAEKELPVLSETRNALLAVVNQKKKEKFDLAGKAIFENLSKALHFFRDFKGQTTYISASRKFQMLFSHLVRKLQEILKKYNARYKFIVQANQYLHPILDSVFSPPPKHPKRPFRKILRSWEEIIASKKTSKKMRGLVNTALKFARSYERGLFVWKKAGLPKTNNGTEIFYHEKKGSYRRNSPNMKIGPTLSLTAPEEMYIPKDLTRNEIQLTLDEMGTREYWEVRAEMKDRSARRTFNRLCRRDIKAMLTEIFNRLEND